MIFRPRAWTLAAYGWFCAVLGAAPVEPGPFFEPDQPFFQTQVEIVPVASPQVQPVNFVVRGLVIPSAVGPAVAFDQELLRVAGLWVVPPDSTPVTPETMAQTSYARPRRKAASAHPAPTGPVLLATGMHPGVATSVDALFQDPRPAANPGDLGRGPLPVTHARFEGVEVKGPVAVIVYTAGNTRIREWSESIDSRAAVQSLTSTAPASEFATPSTSVRWVRHFEVAAHAQPLFFALGSPRAGTWTLDQANGAAANGSSGEATRVDANSDAITFSVRDGELIASFAPASDPQRVSIGFNFSSSSAGTSTSAAAAPTPSVPAAVHTLRWSGSATAPAQLGTISENGLLFDRIAVPEENPWRRRVRAADLAFLDDDRAAVVTYDGDVWIVSGFADEALKKLTWRRFASGLSEPLAIAAPIQLIQVATKNGIVRLHDRDTNGEADWYENFNDQLIQSQTSRSFPLDMAVGPDGSTYVTQGGIVNQSGIKSGGTGTPHSGAILKISPDGRSSHVFARAAREPFVAVHPKTGVVTGTDQQGHFIPSSVSYVIRDGDSFGFLELHPTKLTPPLVWIPHEQDTSSSSESWIMGAGMGPWNGALLHLSYGTGRMFIISPDLDAAVPQGAAIPLDLKTDFPLLHARMHPRGDAVYVAGFQIWGTRTATQWGLARLRVGSTPVVTAIRARSTSEGVVLEFAEPVDPASLTAKNIVVRAWNYVRSAEYGSGRYTLEGAPGTTAIGVGQIVASADRKSVFVHLPHLAPADQLEVRHEFRLASGATTGSVVYFTIHQPHPMDLAAAGFGQVDLSKSVVVVTQRQEELPSPELGKKLAENLGCAACHSTDGTTDGKVGPTWKRLYGSRRTFVDGTSETADELYLRAKILDPMKKRVTTTPAEMPSYRGVVSEAELESLVLYIKTLRAPLPGDAKARTDGDQDK
ncbi:MAG: DUF6797 domain-containing protein [Opitutus sp.]